MEVRNLFLVVLYKKDIDTSETLFSLVEAKDLLLNTNILIWDNSPEPTLDVTGLKAILKGTSDIFYYSGNGNKSLSSIYNFAINNYVKDYHYLTILDDDTYLTRAFLKELNGQTKKQEQDLILPRIISNNKMVSPAKLFLFFGSYFNEIKGNILAATNVTAINSGMSIKSAYFDRYDFRYDENLAFYGTDDDFMKAYCRNNDILYVLDCKLIHKLSHYSKEALTTKAWRFKETLKGLLYLNSYNIFLKMLAYFYVVIKSVIAAIKYRSVEFLYLKWKS